MSERRLKGSFGEWKVDWTIIERLTSLNRRFRLGLALDSWPTKLEMPEYADPEIWHPIKQQVSILHKNDKQRLTCALDAYEDWAQKAANDVNWVLKGEADPRLLGEPETHVKQLKRYLKITIKSTIESQEVDVLDAEQSLMPKSSVRLSYGSAQNVAYPHFSEEDTVTIAKSKSAGRGEGSFSSSARNVISPALSATEDETPRPSIDKLITIKKRSRSSVGDDSRSAKSSRPSPPLRNPTRITSAVTSFETMMSGRSSLQGGHAKASQTKSFIDTPASSFSSSLPLQPASKDRLASNSRVTSSRVTQQRKNACEIQQDKATPPKLINKVKETSDVASESGLSQMASSLQLALIEKDRELQTLPTSGPIVFGSLPDAHSPKTSSAGSLPVGVQGVSSVKITLPTDQKQQQCMSCYWSIFLNGASPFEKAKIPVKSLPYRQIYETARYALDTDLDLSEAIENAGIFDDNNDLWDYLKHRNKPKTLPQKASKEAWSLANSNSDSVMFSGKLEAADIRSNCLDLKFKLNPVATSTYSNRLARKFGAIRFFTLEVPQITSKDFADIKDRFEAWLTESRHFFLGRIWRTYFMKPTKFKSKAQKLNKKAQVGPTFQVYMFAEEGSDIPSMTLYDMLDWQLSFRKNRKQSALKLFSRIALGLTDTTPGIIFDRKQIFFVDDAYSCCSGPRRLRTEVDKGHTHAEGAHVMNDGAGQISFAAAQKICQYSKLPYMPCAFQGRIGGAKGVWIVDYTSATSGEVWIEITKSQAKYKIPSSKSKEEPLLRTLDLHSFSPEELHPRELVESLIPVLTNRGVPKEAFFKLQSDGLNSQLVELQSAMRGGGSILRQWVRDNLSASAERSISGEMKMSGGFPQSLCDQMNMLIDAGFSPTSDHVLYSYCEKAIKLYAVDLEKRATIPLRRSTVALMIPDPLGVLEEGEVQINFSKPFEDPETGTPYKFLSEDVLVARFPLYLPHDVQRVRAVFKPALAQYENVIIFPVKSSTGNPSLATYLSGGDYDGDKAFICWEPMLVKPFKNARFQEAPSHLDFGISKEEDTTHEVLKRGGGDEFIKNGFKFNMKDNMLGICANWYVSYNYHKGSIEDLTEVGAMLGWLVDAPKQGFVFGNEEWRTYLKKRELKKRYKKPWYKLDWKERHHEKPTSHILDQLCLRRQEICEAGVKKAFGDAMREKPSSFDATFTNIYEHEKSQIYLALGKKQSLIFQKLDNDMDELHKWFENWRDKILDREKRKTKNGLTLETRQQNFASFLCKLRERFMKLEPAEENYSLRERWLQDCKLNTVLSSTSGSWTKLKASALYKKTYKMTLENKFPWLVAGIELCRMKAESFGEPNLVVRPNVYMALKPDSRYVRKLKESIAMTEEEEYPGMEDDISSNGDWLSVAGTIDDLQ